MAKAHFEPRARADLIEIGRHTLDRWGAAQARRYLSQLKDGCDALAERPYLGRSCEAIRAGARRFEQGRHVIFYKQHSGGIRILRILHEKMLPKLHVVEDEDS